MARAGARSSYRARKTLPTLDRYNRLNSFDQLICYYYWRCLITQGMEGWDTKKAGWKIHWSHFPALKERYTPSAFYSLGKSMVELAKELSSQGHHLNEPDISGVKFGNSDEKRVNFEDEQFVEEEEDIIEEGVFDNFHITMPQKTSPPTKIKAVDANKRVLNEAEQTLPYPMVFGSFKTFNFTTRKRHTNVVFHLLVHSFLTIRDIEFTWVHPWKLKIRVAWPDWWVNPEQQAEFDVNENSGAPTYPITHQLIGEIMENNEARREEDGRVWDEGYFVFDQNMSTDPTDTDIRLKPLAVSSLGQTGKFISVKAIVANNEEKKRSPMKAMLSIRTAKPGTGGAGESSKNTRKQPDSMDTEENFEDATSGPTEGGSPRKSPRLSNRVNAQTNHVVPPL